MSQWQGKSKGSKLGYRIVIFVCNHFGIMPTYFLLRFISAYYFLFSHSSSKPLLYYFQKRHGFGLLKSLRLLSKNYYVFAQTLLDKIIIISGIKHNFTFDFEGEENLHQMVKGGRGGILISAHVGNWEAAGQLLQNVKTKINIVMFDGEQMQLKNYLNEVTGPRSFNVIVVRDNLSHVYEIAEALQNNEIICLHADRFLPGNKTRSISFLNEQAQFPLGPFVIAATFKVPVSYVFAFKDSATHYHLYGSKPIVFSSDELRAQIINLQMQGYVYRLEELMKKYPEQWFNYYNFWEIKP